jgi:hypothetical protein
MTIFWQSLKNSRNCDVAKFIQFQYDYSNILTILSLHQATLRRDFN